MFTKTMIESQSFFSTGFVEMNQDNLISHLLSLLSSWRSNLNPSRGSIFTQRRKMSVLESKCLKKKQTNFIFNWTMPHIRYYWEIAITCCLLYINKYNKCRRNKIWLCFTFDIISQTWLIDFQNETSKWKKMPMENNSM